MSVALRQRVTGDFNLIVEDTEILDGGRVRVGVGVTILRGGRGGCGEGNSGSILTAGNGGVGVDGKDRIASSE